MTTRDPTSVNVARRRADRPTRSQVDRFGSREPGPGTRDSRPDARFARACTLGPRPAAGLRRARCGFSLAELLVAIGVLGIGLTMVACFFPVVVYQHAETTAQQKAMVIARQAKETVLSEPAGVTNLDPPYADPSVWHLTNEYMPLNPDAYLQMVEPPIAHPDMGEPSQVVEFAKKPRFVWYLFRRKKPQGVEEFFVAVTRTMGGRRYWIHQQLGGPGESMFPQPWAMFFRATGDRILTPFPVGEFVLPPDFSVRDAFPPGTTIRGDSTGLLYTVLIVDGTGGVVLRERLDPADNSALPLSEPKGARMFTWFPPALDGDESPYVAGLAF